MLWLGVDVGGTFTDLVLVDRDAGEIRTLKTPSTPANQSDAILAGIRKLAVAPSALSRIAHGTTVATNTALERNGARLAVLVTEGHKDVLVVGRGNRMAVYDIKAPPPRPLVPRSQCLEVRERLRADGSVDVPLDTAQVEAIAEQLAALDVEAVAICFLHAYVNPAHERLCADLIARKLPSVAVTTSSQVLPEFREYERFSTTALNAYVAPRMRRYLGDLRRELLESGCEAPLSVMTSGGGTLPARQVEDMPVLTMLSGPAAGVIAAAHVGAASGYPDLITCDMGGTSTDVCLLRGDSFAMTTEGRVGDFPVRIRQIDIHSIAVGGGSIASYRRGFLTVGPRSAGSRPGPACYGRGGVEPTVTDANVVLGRLGVDRKLGGEVSLDREAARQAVGRLGAELGLGCEALADGILRLGVLALAGAVKEISVMRGIDPRGFALMPYGGAGALHAAAIADELGMTTVVVPPLPGNFSALGLLLADFRRDFVRTRVSTTSATSVEELRAVFAELTARGGDELTKAGVPPARRRFAASLDMRYAGQSFELSVPIPDRADMPAIEQAFGQVYRARYGGTKAAPIEIVSYRVAAWGMTEKPALPTVEPAGRSLATAASGRRDVVLEGRRREVPIYDRDRLPVDVPIDGPALVDESGTSTVVPPGWTAELAPTGCLVLRRSVR